MWQAAKRVTAPTHQPSVRLLHVQGTTLFVIGATLFVLLQPVRCRKRSTMLLPVAVLSVTLEGQPTTIPLSEFVTVLPITVPAATIPDWAPET